MLQLTLVAVGTGVLVGGTRVAVEVGAACVLAGGGGGGGGGVEPGSPEANDGGLVVQKLSGPIWQAEQPGLYAGRMVHKSYGSIGPAERLTWKWRCITS